MTARTYDILIGVVAVAIVGVLTWPYLRARPNPDAPPQTAVATAPAAPRRTAPPPAPPRPTPLPAPTEPLALLSVTNEISAGGGYAIVTGEVKNISGQSLKNVEAVATWYDKDGGFIRSDSTLIAYNPILIGQTSPYKVMSTHNPAMAKYSIGFKSLFGTAIASRDDRKKSADQRP